MVVDVVLVFVVVRDVVSVVVTVVAVSLSGLLVDVVSVSVVIVMVVVVVPMSVVVVSMSVVSVAVSVVEVTVSVVVVNFDDSNNWVSIRDVSLDVSHEFVLLVHVGAFLGHVGVFVGHVVTALSVVSISFGVLGSLVGSEVIHSVGVISSIVGVFLENSLSVSVISNQSVLLGVVSSVGGDETVLLGVMSSVGSDQSILFGVVSHGVSNVSVKCVLNTINLAHDDTLSVKGGVELRTIAVSSVLNLSDGTLGHVVFAVETWDLTSDPVSVIFNVMEHVVVVFDFLFDSVSLGFASSVSGIVDQISLSIFSLHGDLFVDQHTVLGQDSVLVLVHFSVDVESVHDLVESSTLLVQVSVEVRHRRVVHDHFLFFDDVVVGDGIFLVVHMGALGGAFGSVERTVAFKPDVQVVVLTVGSALIHVEVTVGSADGLGLSVGWAFTLAVLLSAPHVALVFFSRFTVKGLGDVASETGDFTSVADNISVFVADTSKGGVA